MSDEQPTQAVDPAEAAPVVPAFRQAQDAATTPAADAQPTEPDSVEKLPKWAQKLVQDLRQENASHRTAKTKAEKAAEETARLTAEKQGEFERLYKETLSKFEQAEARARTAELDRLKTRIGAKLALPAQLQDRLRGETEEEIEADARTLLAALPKQTPITSNDAGQGVNGSSPTQQYTDEEIRAMAANYGVKFEHLKATLTK